MTTALQTILSTPIVYSVTEEALGIIESNWETVPDCHERENYEIVRKGISEIVGLRGDIERRRKAKKKDALEYGRKVDKAAQAIISRLYSVENRLKTAKGEIDEEKRLEKERKKEEERERVDELRAKVQFIRDMGAIRIDDTATTLRERAIAAEVMEIDIAEYQDLTGKAIAAKMEAIGILNDAAIAMAAREKREAEEREELTRQREAQKAEAERLEKLEEARAERERLEAENHAIEKARLAQERKKLEEERRKVAKELIEHDRAECAKLEEERRKIQAEQEERERQAREAAMQRQKEENIQLAKERAEMKAEQKELERVAHEKDAARRKEEDARVAKERAEFVVQCQQIEDKRQRIAEAQALIDEENGRREEERLAKEQDDREAEERAKNEKLQAKRLKEITMAIAKVIETEEAMDAASVYVKDDGSFRAIAHAIVNGEIPYVKYVG